MCALGGQQTQNVTNRRTDDLLAEPIGIFDLKIIANGNSLIFFFCRSQSCSLIMFNTPGCHLILSTFERCRFGDTKEYWDNIRLTC